jgi:DNA recombination protein RmuC
MSGLAIHSEFSEATDGSFADVVSIQLPGTKRIIIHSLPDIQPYRDAIDAATEAECTAKLAELAAGVRAHLGSVESGGKELAVAFLPGDVLLGVALEQDPDLLEFAAQRGVVVATPNSLVGLLGTAAASWRQHRLSAELTGVRAQNQGLFAQMAQLAGSVDTLRSSLGAAMSTFERPEEETAPAATPSESEGELLASGVS